MNVPRLAGATALGRSPLVAASLALCVVVIAVRAVLGDGPTAELLCGAAAVGAALVAAWVCRQAAARAGGDGRGWNIVALSLVLLAGSVLIHVAYVAIAGEDPVPSFTDATILLSKAVAVGGLLAFPLHASTRASAWRSRFEAVLLASAALYFFWILVAATGFTDQFDVLAPMIMGLGPMLDLLAVALALVLASSRPPAQRGPWMLLAAGLAAMTVTDVFIVLIEVQSTPERTTAVYGSGFVSFGLIALAALTSRTPSIPMEPPPPRDVVSSALPLVLIGANLVLMVVAGQRGGDGAPPAWVMVAAGTSWLAWQIALLLENAGLNRSIRQEAARFQAVVDLAPIAIVETDLAGRIEHWNHEAERLFGRTSADMVGTRPDVVPANIPEGEGPVRRVVRGEVLRNEVMHLTTLDDQPLELVVSAAPIRDESGTMTRVICVASDDRPRRLTEAALFEAQKLQALDRLAGGLAHDFNNLLAVMLSNAELMMSEPARSQDDQEVLADVIEAGRRAAGLVDQLVTYSRRRIDLHPEAVDLNEMVRRVAPVLRRVGGNAITLDLSLAPDLPPVLVDVAGIEQAVIELVLNAGEAMPAGGTIRVETAPVVLGAHDAARGALDAGPYARVTVHDEGAGIDPAVVGELFEPFFTTKARQVGTGLGLSTVQGFVMRAGGRVDVQSEPGLGSAFSVLLPCAPEAAVAPETPLGSLEGADASPSDSLPPRPPPTILLVDDEVPVRRAAARILERSGFHVEQAGSGADALTVLRGDHVSIDLLLSDVRMPGMSGVELAEHLWERSPHLPVVLMSGYAGDEAVDALLARGGVWTLPKPFTRDSLLQAVEGGFSRSVSPAAGQPAPT